MEDSLSEGYKMQEIIDTLFDSLCTFLQQAIPISMVLNMQQRSTDKQDLKKTVFRIFGTVGAAIVIAGFAGGLGAYITIQINEKSIGNIEKSVERINKNVHELDRRIYEHVRNHKR